MGPKLRDWLRQRPFTLTMSSGFFSFFAHCGMLSALQESGLRPAAVAGSSAGALTGELWASGLSSNAIRDLYFSIRRGDFWDPAPGLGLLRGQRLRALIRRSAPAERLENCRCPVRISVFDGVRLRTRVLSSGDLASALYASCAVPLMFQPIRLAGGVLIDGGVSDRPGMAGVPDDERVFYHHIASRSPWRRRNSRALQIPERKNMATLVIEGLPRPGPNDLGQGEAAWSRARDATHRALEKHVNRGVVAVAASRSPMPRQGAVG
jgi:NTE family protein